MMKMYFNKSILSVTMFLFAGLMSAYAQKSVTGIVVDAFTGRPLPGVKVYEGKGEVSTMTGLDGSFKLESGSAIGKVKAAYGGYTGFAKKGKPEMKMKMWKSGASYTDNSFVSFQMAVPDVVSLRPAFGLMAGWCRNVGGYVKGVFRGGKPDDVSYMDVYEWDMWTTGKQSMTYNAFVAGAMLRLMSPVHLCFGVGGTKSDRFYEISGGKWLHRSMTDDNYNFVMDFSLAFKTGPVILNAGLLYCPYEGGSAGSFGVGYCF